MFTKHARILLAGLPALCILATTGRLAAQTPAADPRDDNSPWGMGTSAEWSNQYPKFNPMLSQAGVRWVREFAEWGTIEPRPGQWNWDVTDKIVADAKTNHLHVFATWCYFTPWASADGGSRRGPIKDMQYWKDYVTASVGRYQKDIKYWEVWNEFNGSFYSGPNKPKEYADLTTAAYEAARQVDPTAKVGMSVANFDVGFLDQAIKEGAAGHFDFVCVHPYENLGSLADGGEMGYLSLAGNLRKMLAANNQPSNIPLWITEMGYSVPIHPDAAGDAKEAMVLVKGNLLAVVQGFQRIFWFEARGPSYGHGTDLGIIREDWSPRPAYAAYKTMTALLGPEPKYLGWLDAGKGGYGFLFTGVGGTVLAAWAPPGKQNEIAFSTPVRVVDMTGAVTPLGARTPLTLTESPVYIYNPPPDVVQLAQSNMSKPYPWGGDYAHAQVVTCSLGAVNRDDGLGETNLGTTAVVNGLSDSCRRTDISNGSLHGEGHYVYFRVDPQFVPYGTTHLGITVVARRISADKAASMSITYESAKHGYTGAGAGQAIPADEQWHELTWEVKDANFVGQWGWNFRIQVNGGNDFYVKQVSVKKLGDM